MLLLRVGRLRRWERSRDPGNPDDVAEAARDLQRGEGEPGLSLYRVEDEGDCREVAVRFGITQRGAPQHVDSVVFPSDLATDLGLTVVSIPCLGLDPYLNDRHHEILGLTPELGLRLAEAILAHAERRVERIRERDLITLGRELCRQHPEVRGYLKGSWPELLDPNPGGSGTEG
jgi:hypothetical protein